MIKYRVDSVMASINSKLMILVGVMIFGILATAAGTYVDIATDDKKQERINFLDKRVEELEQRLRAARDRADTCESGTPMPTINKVN